VDPASDPLNNPPDSLRIIIPFIPPTSNNSYVTDFRRKMTFKSKEATAFENRFISEVVPKYLPWISRMAVDDQITYDVLVLFYFDQWDIMNKGFFQTPRKAASRYKKMDTGNRLKLLHDCLSKALGVDDCHFFDLRASKRSAQEYQVDPQVQIFVTRIAPPSPPGGTQCQLPMMEKR
jgi:Holliday junction resolvase RusA-like endonuclease